MARRGETEASPHHRGMMSYLYIMVVSAAVSLALVPVMSRLAPYLGMVDEPDPRKVHASPIPRVGGWGIVLGALLSIALLIPVDRTVFCYLFGVLVLFGFGSWDDRHELGHYTKFIGQLVAVLPLITYGGLYIEQLPLFGEVPPILGVPFTAFALIGMINALNHSDGLDGLAGGEALLSLAAISLLAYIVDGELVLMLAMAALGGALGFLRYNTHPAKVFMGDGGSQFLGFTLGFLAVLLTQRVDPSLSPAVVLFLLGLPIADILVVLGMRARQKMHWFLATRNHLHHRLLELGFVHQESVVIIYSLQTIFVLSGVFLRHEPNWLIICLYVLACGLLFTLVRLAERHGWRANVERPSDSPGWLGDKLSFVRHQALVVAPRRFLELAIPVYLIVVSMSVTQVPRDFGVAATGVLAVLLLESFMSNSLRSIVLRALVYIIGAFIVYLGYNYPPLDLPWLDNLRFGFFLAVALAIAIAIKFSPRRRTYEFETTAMDYLMIFIVLTSLVVVQTMPASVGVGLFVVEVAILLYGCELLIIEKRERWTSLTLSSLGAAGILASRGLLAL